MRGLTAVQLAMWIDEMAEKFGAVVQETVADVFPAELQVEDFLLAQADAEFERARRDRKTIVFRLRAVWPHIAFVQAVARLGRPACPAVDPDDVGFVPSVDGKPASLIGDPLRRALAWMERTPCPTVLGRGAVVCADRAPMPTEFYPEARVNVPAGERFVPTAIDIDVRDEMLRQATGRYERLDARLAAGEITVQGWAFGCSRTWADTGVSYDVAQTHLVRTPAAEMAQDVALLEWLHRDSYEIASERARVARYADPAERWLAENDTAHAGRKFDPELAVTGMLAGSGEQADRAWLYAKLSQIRTECSREIELQGPKALEGKERRAAIRLGVSLQHRYTLRRLVEAAVESGRDERDFPTAWRACEQWRRAHGLTYADAVQTLAAKLDIDPAAHRVPAASRNVWREIGRGSVGARAETE